LCVGAVFVVCVGAVFVDGAIRALPRAAARAQSSAEALVLAIAAILVSRCLSRSACGLLVLVALLRKNCRRVFTR
jgi:hypothetical protein